MTHAAHYSSLTKAIHWITALLIVVTFISGPGGSETRVYATISDFSRRQHETLGLCVFGLTLIRLLWRPFDTRPIPVRSERWLIAAAAFVQWTLYLLLFAVPLTAIVGAWLEGHPLTLVGSVELPPPFATSHALGASISKLHSLLGDAIMWLGAAHTAAALVHHYALKDDALRAMLPRRRARMT
jgi:cytochrome b561